MLVVTNFVDKSQHGRTNSNCNVMTRARPYLLERAWTRWTLEHMAPTQVEGRWASSFGVSEDIMAKISSRDRIVATVRCGWSCADIRAKLRPSVRRLLMPMRGYRRIPKLLKIMLDAHESSQSGMRLES
jgi:hypothetical protein